MNPILNPLPLKFVSAGRRSAQWATLGLAGILPTLGVSRAENLQTAANGAAAEAPPAPVLGFPVISSEPGTSQSTPLPEDGMLPIPSDPGFPAEPAPFPEGVIEPIVALDPAMIVAPESTESPQPLPEPPAETAKPPNSGDFSNTFGGFPSGNGGFGGNQAFGSRPSGFSNIPNAFISGNSLTDSLKDGLSLSANLTGTYDTNPSQGYGAATDSGEGDFFVTLGGSVGYRSTASDVTYGLNYSGGYSEYFTQSDLSGYNQSAGGSINYEGGPLSATFNLGVNFGSGANRYYESVVDELSYNYGLSARYRISSKTSLTGNLSQSFSSASGSGASDTGSFSLGASAMWRYSPLTEFGPGIRYTAESGDTQPDRTSIGPTMTVNYKLSRKVSLNSQLGLDFAEYEGGESADPSLFAAISLAYQASSLWGMNLGLNRSTQADPGRAGQYSEVTSFRIGYNRKIRRAAWNLGVSYETTTSEVPDVVTSGFDPNVEDREYLSFDTSLGMPVFANTCNASVFLRYSDQSGESTGETGDSVQTGFSISRSF